MRKPDPAVNVTLRIGSSAMDRLRAHHLTAAKVTEALSYARGHAIQIRGRLVVTIPGADALILPDRDCFLAQSGGNVRLRPSILNSIMASFAASEYNCLVNIHDHFFSEYTTFSSIDDADDRAFDRYLRERFEPMLRNNPAIGVARNVFNLSVVLAQKGLDARVVDTRTEGDFRPVRVVEVGERLTRPATGWRMERSPRRPVEEARHSDFISDPDRDLIRSLRVGIVGCGGLGSILSEALGRVGFGSMVLVDEDIVDASNLNRWQGGEPEHVGLGKATTLAGRLHRMFPAATVEAVAASLYSPAAKAALTGCDLVIGAVDNDAARYCINRLSVQYMVPYFDAGVLIQAGASGVDFKSRYFAVLPGTSSCLECTGFELIDRACAQRAFLHPATLDSMRSSGYVKDDVAPSAPSVYALNLRASALLVTELLNYVCGWRRTATVVSESWRSGSFQRADRENFPERPASACPVCGLLIGVGDLEPLPVPAPSPDFAFTPHKTGTDERL